VSFQFQFIAPAGGKTAQEKSFDTAAKARQIAGELAAKFPLPCKGADALNAGLM